jgi:hypothetical protein
MFVKVFINPQGNGKQKRIYAAESAAVMVSRQHVEIQGTARNPHTSAGSFKHSRARGLAFTAQTSPEICAPGDQRVERTGLEYRDRLRN